LFNLSLKEPHAHRLVYSTSVGFRLVFLATALAIALVVLPAAKGPAYLQFRIVTLIIVGLCLLAALYLERWIFDKQSNLFERDVGILFVYSRKTLALDDLQKVVLQEPGMRSLDSSRRTLRLSRRSAILSVVDRDGTAYRLDLVKGGALRETRKLAEKLSAFCAIPFEDDLQDAATEIEP